VIEHATRRARWVGVALGCLAIAASTAQGAPAPGWAGPPLAEMGWTGLGLYDSAWAAYRRPVAAAPPVATAPGPAPAAATATAAAKPRIWERIEYPAAKTDLSPSYRSYVALLEVDCQAGATTVLQWTTYSRNNLSGGVAGALDTAGPPVFVLPGSIDDRLRRIACAWK